MPIEVGRLYKLRKAIDQRILPRYIYTYERNKETGVKDLDFYWVFVIEKHKEFGDTSVFKGKEIEDYYKVVEDVNGSSREII